MTYLNIYGQSQEHDECYIAGDKESLKRFRDAIDQVLNNEIGAHSENKFFTSDGEGFTIHLLNYREGKYFSLPYCQREGGGIEPYRIIAELKKEKII